MNTALLAVVWFVKLEQPKFYRTCRECGVKVQHVVTAGVVVSVPAVVCTVSGVLDVRKLIHSLGLFGVEPVQKFRADRPAILLCSALGNLDCAAYLLFMRGHDVR